MSREVTPADEVWSALMNLTTHNLREWRKAVSDELDLPFGRVRVLRRLGERPMGMKELAEASGIDAPAATVAVNDLERNGLVERLIDPANRRAKTVSLTAAGVDALARVDRVRPAAPPAFAALDEADLEALQGILDRVERHAAVDAPAAGR
ncbi:MarR family winged helix-turn-helix transcriptional regulator [Subtercola endophyticus]|uniref:MarR family winged helix-turn-helix transcriptional regulator n=1 Tax=Subtercola endophyticus TaxID=2895559 RepID=UPI001E2FD0DD|nr:MarR family transcriptional regulator [Subtercola endophyticus]UFS58441.1 MarR family transcriptional regulator [Subtercola endophyticus]